MTNRAELLACPFCRWQTVYGTSNGEGSSYIECGNCGARGPVSCGEESDVALWNRRATRGDAELLALANEIYSKRGGFIPQSPASVDQCKAWAERLCAIAAQPCLHPRLISDRVTTECRDCGEHLAYQPVGLPELPEPVGFALYSHRQHAPASEGERICDVIPIGDQQRAEMWAYGNTPVFTEKQLRDYAARAAGVDAKDAKRYRYLRNLPLGPLSGSEFTEGLCVDMWSGDGSGEQIRGDSLDAAIDAAISEQAGAEG